MDKKLFKKGFFILFLFLFNGVYGQNVITKNVTAVGACDGGAVLSNNKGCTRIVWKKDGISILEGDTMVKALCVGDYFVEFNDSQNQPKFFEFKIGSTNPNCNMTLNVVKVVKNTSTTAGTCNGGAQVAVIGGIAGFKFNWSNGKNGNVVTGLCAGQYQVTVIDTNKCSATAEVVITDSTATNPNCNLKLSVVKVMKNTLTGSTTCNGGAEVAVTGGTPGFKFNWSNGKIGNKAYGLCAGKYQVTVIDTNKCSATAEVVITDSTATNPNCNLKLSVVKVMKNTLIGSTTCNGGAEVAVTGGTPGFKFNWSNGKNGNKAYGLCAGKYQVTVIDTNKCSATAEVVITDSTATNPNCNLKLSVVKVMKNTLTGSTTCNGGAEVAVTGGTPGFKFNWSNGKIGNKAYGLCAGKYQVTVIDTNKCSATAEVVITDSTATNPNCNLKLSVVKVMKNTLIGSTTCNGGAEVAVTGGTPGFKFNWSNGKNGNKAYGLCAGKYQVTVIDTNKCSATAEVVITDSTATNPNCNLKLSVVKVMKNTLTGSTTCNGGAEVAVTGGTPGFKFNWSNGKNGNKAYGLCAGKYQVTVIDTNKCSATAEVVITDSTATNPNCNLKLSVVKVMKNTLTGSTTCNGGAEVAVTGGTPGFKFNWSNGKNGNKAYGLCAGKYQVTVIDTNKCSATAEVVITDSTATNPNCNLKLSVVKVMKNTLTGSTTCNGGAEVAVTGGTPGFKFNWSNGKNGNKAYGLCAGKYQVTVIDTNKCSATAEVVITDSTASNPCQLRLSILKVAKNVPTATGACNGMVQVAAVGGTPNYMFKWSNGKIGASITGLCAGKYFLTVIDSMKCTASLDVIISDTLITKPNCNLKINVVKVVKNTSSTTCNGGASVSVIGGMPSYRINWSNGKSGAYASGLCAGNYTVIAVDSLGCSATAVIVITDTLPTTKQCEGFLINLNAIKNDLKGDTICTGSIITSIVGGKQPINTIWNNGKKDLSIFDLCKGSYTVYARDANGCVVTLTKEIGEDEKITLCEGFFANILVKNTIPSSSTSGCTGSLTTSINGGTAPYAFKWSNGATTSSLEKLCEGVYDVIITDSKNCSIKIQKYISKDSIVLNPCSTLIASLKVGNDKTGDAACTGYMYANVIGGKSPYTYVWSNKEILPGIKGLCKGDYSVLITDANKCQLKLEGQLGLDTIVNPCANFFAKIAGVQKTALSKCTGMLSVKVDGGLAPYDFNWSNGVKSPSATDLCAGKYYVEVKDAQGCKIALDGFVGIDSIVSSCEGFYAKVTSILNDKAGDNVCTGYIKTQTFGGKSPYAYKWNTGATTTNLDKACSGKYSLEITDANKCKFVLERVVGSDSIVDKCKSFYAYISEQTDDAEENPICEGKLAVKTVNGLAPFKFNWSTGETTASINELCYDTYKVLISDANQCQVVLCATVQKKKTENTKLEVIINTKDATSATACDGAAKIDVKGGTAPYYFYHSNGEVNFYRKGICSGVHSVIVKDSKGQVAELKFMISAPTNVFTTKPKKDSLIIDTVKTILTKECEIDFNAIDSVRIKEHKMLSKDSLRITWAIFSGTKIVYVSSIYKITKGKGNYTFNLEVYCEGKSLGSFLKAAEDVYIDAEAILGTVTNMETSMSVYPNPFSDQLTIIVPMNDNYTVMLMDITGKIVSQETFMQTNTLNLPLENVANGQYILKVNGTHFTATEKVVK